MESYFELMGQIAKVLPKRRFYHTMGVADTAACLAMRYGCDVERTRLAGLLHDCAKYLPDDELLEKCQAKGLPVSVWERQTPHLLHAKLGAWFAKERYGVEDEEILSSIRLHTTGKPGMSMLEEIVFVADYIEPGRRMINGLPQVRAAAFTHLDEAVFLAASGTLQHLEQSGEPIDPATRETVEYYQYKR